MRMIPQTRIFRQGYKDFSVVMLLALTEFKNCFLECFAVTKKFHGTLV